MKRSKRQADIYPNAKQRRVTEQFHVAYGLKNLYRQKYVKYGGRIKIQDGGHQGAFQSWVLIEK